MAKAGNLKLDFMAKSIGIHFFEFEDMFRCYRDNENLKKKYFGHMEMKGKKKDEMNVASYGSNCTRSFLVISFSGVRFELAQGKKYPPSTKE